jgi:uncharacterized paraquat-inducible protein A
LATYAKKNPRDHFIVMREGHHGAHALVCCDCGTLVIAGPRALHKHGCACPRAGCESHYFTEKTAAGESYVVGVLVHHR